MGEYESRAADEELMVRLGDGDAAALELLYDRHGALLYSLALRMLGERELAEEVVQDCFLKLWHAPGKYQRQRGRPLTWLVAVVHNRATDELRRRRARRRLMDGFADDVEETPSQDDGPETQVSDSFDRQRVAGALVQLPPPQRQVIEMAYYGGMTQQEIASALQQPLGTVKTRLRLGLQKLRVQLDDVRASEEVER